MVVAGQNSLTQGVIQALMRHAPFTQMQPEHVSFAVKHLELSYFDEGEVIVEPASGPPEHLFIVKQGTVEGHRVLSESAVLHLTEGEVFPVGALAADRPVSTIYKSADDTFCWKLPKKQFNALQSMSPVFLDFCKRRMAALLDLSNQALQATYATQTTQLAAMDNPIASVITRPAVMASASDSILQVFIQLERERVDSVLIKADEKGAAPVVGIFTRQDVIGRVVLPAKDLQAPISSVMTSPVLYLDSAATVADAMLLMADKGIRHIPIVRTHETEGTSTTDVLGVITERALFVMQRRSLRQIGDTIRVADTVDELVVCGEDIRAWSKQLVAQGVASSFITRLISRLNDQLSMRLVGIIAAKHQLDLQSFCWLSLGSEGRQEQTIATDQDNALIIHDEVLSTAKNKEEVLSAYVAFGREVNVALDRCGYPLCKGNIMAGNPQWCMPYSRWEALFESWIAKGSPESLLNTSIFFDFRHLAGDASLALRLKEIVVPLAKANQRFLKQMSDNALRNHPPNGWTGHLLDQLFLSEQNKVDLKLQGTAIFVDAARLLTMAHGISEASTTARLEALKTAKIIQSEEAKSWQDAFEFLQSLRLRLQHYEKGVDVVQVNEENPNLQDASKLSSLDRRILKETFRQARKLQQRLEVDFP